MAGIADMIMKEFSRAGEPGRSTRTITQPDPGFDPSSLINMLMMLLLSGSFGKGEGGIGQNLLAGQGGGNMELNPFIDLFGTGVGGTGGSTKSNLLSMLPK